MSLISITSLLIMIINDFSASWIFAVFLCLLYYISSVRSTSCTVESPVADISLTFLVL